MAIDIRFEYIWRRGLRRFCLASLALFIASAIAFGVIVRTWPMTWEPSLYESTWTVLNETDHDIKRVAVYALSGEIELDTMPIGRGETQTVETPLRLRGRGYVVKVWFHSSAAPVFGNFRHRTPAGASKIYLRRCRLSVFEDKVVPVFEFSDRRDSRFL